jgi:phage shock protein C
VTDRLYKSRDDRMLAGVAGGVAEMLDADPSIIRIVWAVLIVLTGGIALIVYVIMAIVVPDAPDTPAGDLVATPAAPVPTSVGDASAGQVPPGSWLAPDGSTVAMAAAAAPTRRAGRRDPDDRARGGFIAGVVLIVIGAFFLVRQFVPSIDPGLWWPIAAIALGLLLLVVAVVPPRRPG